MNHLHYQSSSTERSEVEKEKNDASGEQSVSATGEIETVTETQEIKEPITTALASAGHTLEASQAELMLQPLRLAFETKNIKLVEPALDCLHVWVLALLQSSF